MNVRDQIAAARALADAACDGPWEASTWTVKCEGTAEYSCDGGCTVCAGETELAASCVTDNEGASIIASIGEMNTHSGHAVGEHIKTFGLEDFAKADAAFIAASRTLVPQLATLLERACELLESQADAIEWPASIGPGDRGNLVCDVRAFLAGEVTKP